MDIDKFINFEDQKRDGRFYNIVLNWGSRYFKLEGKLYENTLFKDRKSNEILGYLVSEGTGDEYLVKGKTKYSNNDCFNLTLIPTSRKRGAKLMLELNRMNKTNLYSIDMFTSCIKHQYGEEYIDHEIKPNDLVVKIEEFKYRNVSETTYKYILSQDKFNNVQQDIIKRKTYYNYNKIYK